VREGQEVWPKFVFCFHASLEQLALGRPGGSLEKKTLGKRRRAGLPLFVFQMKSVTWGKKRTFPYRGLNAGSGP
jgi:hypothetical protein